MPVQKLEYTDAPASLTTTVCGLLLGIFLITSLTKRSVSREAVPLPILAINSTLCLSIN